MTLKDIIELTRIPRPPEATYMITNRFSRTCLICYYFRFAGFDRWCAHPRHHQKIKNEYQACSDWIDMFEKAADFINKLPMEDTLKLKMINDIHD
jgi:hypothetical protein